MKILIATGIFPPDIGGPATYTAAIADEFSARGHQVTVITYQSLFCKPQANAYNLVGISRRLPKGIRHIVYFWKVLRRGRDADFIYAQDAASAGFPAMIAAKLSRKKLILKIVGDYAWEQGAQRFGVKELLDEFLSKRYGLRVMLLRFIEKSVSRAAARIIVPSEYLKGVVAQWEIDKKKISVIPNAAPLIFLTSDVKKNVALGRIKNPIFLSVGRLVPWKGFDMLIDLMDDFPEAKLIIVGDGPEHKKLKTQNAKRKVQNAVLIGSKPKEELIDLYQKAALFLLNTGYEGFSHQILEVMAAGLSIVTTDAGGNKEIIRDRENALIAGYNEKEEWKNAIRKLLTDAQLRGRLSKNARATAQEYSKERMIKRTLMVFQSFSL